MGRTTVQTSFANENQTFGHCFVCVRCPQNGNENPIPYCRGWWPADPNGGDYEGDGGVINSDETEDWDRIDCISLSSIESQKIKTTIYNYGTKNDYQVINNGGRSCLGYCSDIASVVGLPHELKWNDYTIPGDMRFPTSRWGSDNIEQHPWLAVEEIFTVYEQQNTQME